MIPQKTRSTDPRATPGAATGQSDLGGLLVERSIVDDFLDQVAPLAATMVNGASCGITMRRYREISTVASSDGFAIAADEIQYGRGQGPCLEALHTGRVVRVDDLALDSRWSDYRVHALTYGVRSSLSIPLLGPGGTRGALNLYHRQASAFGPTESERCETLARLASSALTIIVAAAEQMELVGQLRGALATRGTVEQAIGIIMGQSRMDATAAFAVLRQSSQSRNQKLRDVAADLIQTVTGRPPQPARPFAEPR